MSELKELAWSAQQAVEPIPFEQLERRGVRRRHRRQAATGLGVCLATTAAVLASVLTIGNHPRTLEQPPATVPTAPVDAHAEAVINGKDSRVDSVQMAGPNRYAASWWDCRSDPCQVSAVLRWDQQRVTAPVRQVQYAILQAPGQLIAAAGPEGEWFTAKDRTWPKAVLIQLSAQGAARSQLRYAKPTKTFSDDEILTDQITKSGDVLVLNLRDSTLRKLELPFVGTGHLPVRDRTGRWWIAVSEGGASEVAWTDDGGKNWQSTQLDPFNDAGRLAVSQDGRTVVATSSADDAVGDPIVTLMSTDAGVRWRTLETKVSGRVISPVVFDDGTALVVGAAPPQFYPLRSNGTYGPRFAAPDLLELHRTGELIYGSLITGLVHVTVSTDRGRHWTTFEPR